MTQREAYDVRIASPARRALERLPGRVAHAVLEFISGPLAENPHRLGKPLRMEFEGLLSARRGDYRILLRIDEEHRTVLVVDIDHRAHIYRASTRHFSRSHSGKATQAATIATARSGWSGSMPSDARCVRGETG